MAPSKCKQLCLSVGLFATGVLSQNFPSVDNFQRFSRAKATVLGDYIYIDGGEVSQKGRNSRGSDPMNATLSIDCSSSWSPDTVEIREISKPQSLPTLSNQNLFTDTSRNSFYVWGGYVPFDESADSSNLWKFSVDGEGGGSWVREAPGNADFFVDLERTENGATTSSPGAGFVFGGKILDSSSKATGQNEKGTVTFDFGSKNWSQSSEGPFSPDQTLWGATATFVEGFADEGLIFLLGGMNRRDERAAGYLDFETVHFFDVAKRDWYEQKTTGDVPGVRFHHCAVAMTDSNSNETSEIFVYGGWNEDSKTPYSEVHTLTIPGFHWTKLNDDGENHVRAEHQCLNLGNNQLVTIGGLLFTGDVGDDWDLVDPYPRGIGIFDLNELAWKDQYDADAGDYRRHNDTAKWYDEGGLDNVEWSSDATKALFVSPSSNPGSDGGDNSNGGGGSGGNNDSNSGSGSGSSAGAIAGGVVGGVAGIALVGGLVWYLLRKRRAPTAELVAQPLQPSYVGQDLKSPPPPSASPYAVSELQDASHPHQYHAELDAAGMPGSRSELGASNYQR